MSAFLDRLAWATRNGDEKGILMGAALAPKGLRAQLDESGIHKGSRICVIAGYVGSLSEWRRFDAAWGEYADKPGFHAKSFFARDPSGQRVAPYTGWTDSDARAYLAKLIQCICGFNLTAIGAVVDVFAFREYTEEQRRYITGGSTRRGRWLHSGAPTKPYYVAFWKALSESLKLGRDDWKVDFVFDQQHVLAPLALKLYQRLKDDWWVDDYGPRMGDAVFASRREAIGLQAADLLAYCWYQFSLHNDKTDPDIYQALLEQPGEKIVWFCKDHMDKLLGLAEPTPGKTYVFNVSTQRLEPEE